MRRSGSVVSTWRLALFESLSACADPVLAAIAAKGVNELAYHRDYAAGWVVRLGDGTALSHEKTQAALDALWPLLTPEQMAEPMTIGVEAYVSEEYARAERDKLWRKV